MPKFKTKLIKLQDGSKYLFRESKSKYMPHQGAKEIARRLRQYNIRNNLMFTSYKGYNIFTGEKVVGEIHGTP